MEDVGEFVHVFGDLDHLPRRSRLADLEFVLELAQPDSGGSTPECLNLWCNGPTRDFLIAIHRSYSRRHLSGLALLTALYCCIYI